MTRRLGFPDLTHLRLPHVPGLPAADLGRVTRVAEDVAYVAIGLGILGFQQMQVRRREIARSLERRRPR